MVLIDVRAVLLGALIAHAGAHDLAQAVEVVRLQAEPVLYLAAHVLRPGLRPESADAQLDLVATDAHLLHGLSQMEGIGRRAGDAGRPEVSQQADVLLGVAGGSRQDGRSERFHSVVDAEAAGEQSVAVPYGENVIACEAV